jgi:protein-S-isoprenylcysteine O-methyltransferase Ste14
MIPDSGRVIGVLWVIWLGYWIAAARNTRPPRRREAPARRFLWHLTFVAGALLLALPDGGAHWFDRRFLPVSAAASDIGTLMVAAGLALAVWARRHLGANWSGEVMLKQVHELIQTGPFRLIRHPIYAGLLLALSGSALARGEWRGIAGLLLFGTGIMRRILVEERWMREAFGAEHARYSARTARLVPCVF